MHEVHAVFLVVSARNPRNPFANNQCPSSVYFGTYPIDTQRNDTQVDLLWWTVCGYLFDEDALHSNRGKLFEVFVAKPSNRTFTSDREIRKLSRKRNETKGLLVIGWPVRPGLEFLYTQQDTRELHILKQAAGVRNHVRRTRTGGREVMLAITFHELLILYSFDAQQS